MKFVVSVILLLSLVHAQEIDGRYNERYLSKELNELSGLFGCASNCTYKPLNVAQLAVCTAAIHLGDKMNHLFTCGTKTIESDPPENSATACVGTMDSAGADSAPCVWVKIPGSWDNLSVKHFCLPKIVADNQIALLGTLSAFKPLFESFRLLHPATFISDTMTCLAQSNTASGQCATATLTNTNLKCEPCDDIPAKYYPTTTTTTTITRLCLPSTIQDTACTLLKQLAADKERPYCPLKDVKATLPKACKGNECPQPPACPAT